MESILYRVYSSRGISAFLKAVSTVCALSAVLAYVFLLYERFVLSYVDAVKFILMSAVPFLLVSVARRLIDAPRPYELYDFYEKKPKKKCGSSFPSRHVFSIFLIATLALPYYLWMGISLYAIGAVLALSRVLLGVHFIRDVAAGAVIGAFAGFFGILCF